MKRRLTLLKFLVTAIMLGLIFRERGLMAAVIPRLHLMLSNWRWTLAGVACLGAACWLNALRWQVLLRRQKNMAPASEILRVTLIGHFFNTTSFGTAGGDAYRVVALDPAAKEPRLPILATVVLCHMLGAVAMACLFLPCRFLYRERFAEFGPQVSALINGYTTVTLCILFAVFMAFLSFLPTCYRRGEARFPRLLRWPPLKTLASVGETQCRDWLGCLLVISLSVALFFSQFLSFYCALFAVGGRAPLFELVAIMPLVSFAAGLPVSVSGLGPREATFQVLMSAFTGLAGSIAISASLAAWLMSIIWALVGSVLFLARNRLPQRAEQIPSNQHETGPLSGSQIHLPRRQTQA